MKAQTETAAQLQAAIRSSQSPTIRPLPAGQTRPFWSVMVPTRDRDTHLRETLGSILSQAPDPKEMQIEVVDNCSTTVDVETLVRDVGGGRIAYYRQPSPASISENWTTCVSRANGYWVHVMHDDDILEPQFYDTYRAMIDDEPQVVLVACQARQIDEHGRAGGLRFSPAGVNRSGLLEDSRRQIAECNWVSPPSVAVRRSAYEQVGGYRPLSHVLDWDMWLRLAAVGPVAYVHAPLIRQRFHGNTASARSFKTGRHIAEIAALIDEIVEHLPEHQRVGVRSAACAEYAGYAEHMCLALASQREYRAALSHLRWAWRLEPGTPRFASMSRRLRGRLLGRVLQLTRSFRPLSSP